jgi:hypothetical protein
MHKIIPIMLRENLMNKLDVSKMPCELKMTEIRTISSKNPN